MCGPLVRCLFLLQAEWLKNVAKQPHGTATSRGPAVGPSFIPGTCGPKLRGEVIIARWMLNVNDYLTIWVCLKIRHTTQNVPLDREHD